MEFVKRNFRLIVIGVMMLWALFSVFSFQLINQPAAKLGAQNQPVNAPLESPRKPFLVIANFNVYSNIKLGLDLIGGSQFEFKALPSEAVPVINPETMAGLVKVFENRVNASGTTEAVVQQVGKDRVLVEVPGANPQAVKRRLLATAFLEFAQMNDKGEWVSTGITGADFKKAQAMSDGGMGWAVNFDLKPDSARKFSELTAKLIGKPLAIFLDGNLISAPTVKSVISGGSGQISGDFSVEDAQDLAVQLNAGALPVPVKILTERSISATLGQESINKSLWAGVLGFALVVIFMISMYRFSGAVASLALFIYVFLTLAVFKDTVTLTLAGVAGFILSIGMAVDANILIFERAKEEMATGKSVLVGMRDGFDKAYSSIFDSNMNTSIVSLVLIIFGTGIVKGFAVTLLLGVLISLFSSLFVTKTLLFFFVDLFKIKEAKFFA